MTPKRTASVTLTQDTAVVRRRGVSRVSVAGILAREVQDGTERVYLDRLLHRLDDIELDGWQVSGAISTILERRVLGPPAD